MYIVYSVFAVAVYDCIVSSWYTCLEEPWSRLSVCKMLNMVGQ